VEFETVKIRDEGAVLFAAIAAAPMNLLGPELLTPLWRRGRVDRAVNVGSGDAHLLIAGSSTHDGDFAVCDHCPALNTPAPEIHTQLDTPRGGFQFKL
jgi:hypothetical protein